MVTISGETMGTTYNVKYINLNNQATELSADEMKAKIDKLLINVNQLMSTYIPNSELSLLNKAPKNVAFAISPATQYVIQEALKLHDISEGMLDITVGPLVNQWGFGPTLRANKIPTSEQLKQTMSYVGVDKFTLANNAITKLHPDVYIDLSTIAKGFGVDEVADLLLSEGIKNFLVEIGGEMRVAGKKPNEQNWLIAIEKPITGSRAIQQIVNIGDNAIATSGDYRNYFEENGVRYSHLINPLTGYPIQHNLVSVTVVADKSIEADGLATALMVMGPEKGQALAEKEGIAALFITKELDGFVEKRSLEFSRKVEVILPEKNN
jgi:thiamine biosynthesis lipoprotein